MKITISLAVIFLFPFISLAQKGKVAMKDFIVTSAQYKTALGDAPTDPLPPDAARADVEIWGSGLEYGNWLEIGEKPDMRRWEKTYRQNPDRAFPPLPRHYAEVLKKTDGENPARPIVFGGLVGFRTRPLLKLTSKFRAAGSLPFDAVNLHLYFNENMETTGPGHDEAIMYDLDFYEKTPAHGLCPEANKLRQRAGRFLDILFVGIENEDMKKELAEKEFWLSLFFDPKNIDADLGAQWLARSVLELSAANGGGGNIGFDKILLFDLGQDGFRLPEGSPPARAIRNMGEVLGHAGFVADANEYGEKHFSDGSGKSPHILHFSDEGKDILAIWNPGPVDERHELMVSEPELQTMVERLAPIQKARLVSIAGTGKEIICEFDRQGHLHLDGSTFPVSGMPVFLILE